MILVPSKVSLVWPRQHGDRFCCGPTARPLKQHDGPSSKAGTGIPRNHGALRKTLEILLPLNSYVRRPRHRPGTVQSQSVFTQSC